MNATIFILTITLLVSSCGQKNTNSIKKPTEKKIINLAHTTKKPKPPYCHTILDSIDNANNERIIESGDNITKAVVFVDSTINLTTNPKLDHRMFGYALPDSKSERLLLISIFTDDVEGNPYNCKLGAYYDMSEMDDLT